MSRPLPVVLTVSLQPLSKPAAIAAEGEEELDDDDDNDEDDEEKERAAFAILTNPIRQCERSRDRRVTDLAMPLLKSATAREQKGLSV